MMNEQTPQPPNCEPEDLYGVEHVPDEEADCEATAEWQGLRPELLDRVLDP